MPIVIEGFQYEIGWPAPGRYPGHHRSGSAGAGYEFRGHAPLTSASDARRIDLRASLKDPFGQWIVRTFRQRSAIDLHIVADLSASMGVAGTHRKLDVLADLTAAAAYSAYRTGDAFGFIGADEKLHEELYVPPTRAPGAGIALRAKLRNLEPTGRSAQALARVAALLPRRRCIVFLVSDFHLPQALLEATLDGLASHQVVPVILRDPVEMTPPAGFGLITLRDPETGRERKLLLRPALRRKLTIAYRERAELLSRLFARRGTRPLHVIGPFRAEQVTRYFLGARPEAQPVES
jgi:uncharacterized protein (DUF58 family)